ncbi:ribonuclease H-like domain-containing protein [Tanacetum coccineum]
MFLCGGLVIEFGEWYFIINGGRRCDSTGDLYPVTSPSYPQAFLVGQQTWHQRLGHPGSEVLRLLVSNNLISCNKTQSSVLCHACQLGKHVRLPFSLSETIVKAPFDIIHSDLWTSPLTSVLGIKYYVLFLDHFSHYLWVYPLRHKSDVLSKFIHFRAYVKNHFNCDIKSLQCDHGGAFDNTALHQLLSIRVLHVPSRYQYADIFTKGLPTSLFDEFRTSLSVRLSPAPTAGGC